MTAEANNQNTTPGFAVRANLTPADKARLVMQAIGLDDIGLRLADPGSAPATGEPTAVDKSEIDRVLLEFADALGKYPARSAVPEAAAGDRLNARGTGAGVGLRETVRIGGAIRREAGAREPAGPKSETPGSTPSKTDPGGWLSREHPRISGLMLAGRSTQAARTILERMDRSLAQQAVLHLLAIESRPPQLSPNVAAILGRTSRPPANGD